MGGPMSYRDVVMFNAYNEANQPVHWAKYEDRILDYFKVSTGDKYDKKNALEISWCSYFVHWCLAKGGMSPLPAVGNAKTLGSMGSIGRFIKARGGAYQAFAVIEKNYKPLPGYMYNKLHPNNHIGFVRDSRQTKD